MIDSTELKAVSRVAGVIVLIGFVTLSVWAQEATTEPDIPGLVRSAAADGRLAFKLTTSEEFQALFGAPTRETKEGDGGMEALFLEYLGVWAVFARMREYAAPHTLMAITVGGEELDIGRNRLIVLRREAGLEKFDPFWGFAGVSLARIDLRGRAELLDKMPYDSRTLWPEAEKLPEGSDPVRLLEERKNPGLGVRRLHEQGVDGRGVGIAIIDQPLLRNHVEYAERIARYEEMGVSGMEPQMHGPPVASIAAGKTCGVAPAAALTYFAVPMWERDNAPYCDAIDKIIAFNEDSDQSPAIRVVSISTGMFPQQERFDRWQESLRKAEAHGILVVTCAQEAFAHGMLGLTAKGDPDDPNDYATGIYGVRPGAVLVPAYNRTVASHFGPVVYTFWRQAGLSWATPYAAGVAALAYQVCPTIKPVEIGRLLTETATHTEVGLVVNPAAFVDAASKLSSENR